MDGAQIQKQNLVITYWLSLVNIWFCILEYFTPKGL